MGAKKHNDGHSIAVVGLSCRFPGEGDSPEAFWQSICSGRSAWSSIPKDRFNGEAFWSPTKSRNTITAEGAHFLRQDVSAFDATFFSLSRIETEAIDPQQRIMIEVAYEALESAGLPLEKIAGTKTGVFMGHFTSDYKEMIYRDPESAPMYSATGSCTTSTSGRISWLWDLRGPCFTLDTACSSSLVALHQACLSLRTGESDIAIVGGSNLLLSPDMFMYLSNQDFLAKDGRSKAFDASANGYGRGEGFGCVVLKRVDDALQAGDAVRAVIRGTGSNHDGHTKGLTLPSAEAQAALIRDVYRDAGLEFRDTDYVEAHGTGTQAGDLAEMQALAETIGSAHAPSKKLAVGSVKTNIGHLEAAAGIAGVIKSVLMLERGFIPPNLHFKTPNPKILFDQWNLSVPTQLTAWSTSQVRRASINSFGYAGTNAHAILDGTTSYMEERGLVEVCKSADDSTAMSKHTGKYKPPRLFVWSAQDKDGVARMRKALADYVVKRKDELDASSMEHEDFLARLSFTLSERRSHLQWRTYAFFTNLKELTESISGAEDMASAVQSSRTSRIGFVFTGQGAQWPRMGLELMAYPIFESAVRAADRFLQDVCLCPWSAVEELGRAKSTSKLHLAEYSQTLCAVLQIALVDLLRSWGIYPTAVAGHSSGEIGAAYALGALSREDAWSVAWYRGTLSSSLKSVAPEMDGSMMAVGLTPEKAREWISKVTDGHVVVACINSPTSVTISGDDAGIDQLFGILKAENVFARKLQVDTAYHSPHMNTIAQEYYDCLADLQPLEPREGCTMHSSVTGAIIGADQLGVVNWVRNLTSPVRFSEAIYDMLRPLQRDGKRAEQNAVDMLVEVGPHGALQGPVMQTLAAHNITGIPYHSVLSRGLDAITTAVSLAGTLWARGYDVDISQINHHDNSRTMTPLHDLPSYPWKHTQRYYHDVRVEKEYLSRSKPKLSLIGAPAPTFGQRERSWRRFIRLAEEPWIADHKIQNTVLYPGAGYLAMAIEAACQLADETKQIACLKLRDIQLTAAAIISDEQDVECIIQLRPHVTSTRDSSSTWTEFAVTTSPDGKGLVTNCSGLLIVEYESGSESEATSERCLELEAMQKQYLEIKDACVNRIDCADMYSRFTKLGLEYGPVFANVCEAYSGDGKSHGVVRIPEVPYRKLDASTRPHIVHPGTLDAVFHLAFASILGQGPLTAMVPKFISEVVVSAGIPWEVGTKISGFASSERHGLRDLVTDIGMLHDDARAAAVSISGLVLTEVAGAAVGNAQEGVRSIASKLVWRPAVEFLTADDLQRILEPLDSMDRLLKYLELLHHATPELSLLEISSEPEDAVCVVLPLLSETGKVTFGRTKAAQDSKSESNGLGSSVEFIDLDLPDGLKIDAYDVILIPDLDKHAQQVGYSLSNITKALKPSGRLCALADDSSLAWVQSEWNSAVQDIVVVKGVHRHFIVAKKGENSDQNSHSASKIHLVLPQNPDQAVKALADELAFLCEGKGLKLERFSWGSDLTAVEGASCISLLECQASILEDLSSTDFEAVRSLILKSASIVWVTGFDHPSANIIDGLARVVRNETPGIKFTTFHARKISQHLAEMIFAAFQSASEEDEYLVEDGMLHTGRIEEDDAINHQINALLPNAVKTISKVAIKDAPQALRMTIRTPGMLNTFCMEPDEEADAELDPMDVEISVKVSSINFRDLMTAMGQLPDSKIGVDAAGVVRRVGAAVTKFRPGDRVAFFGFGAHSTRPRTRADNCALIPSGMSFEQAASIPTIHGTAWYALVRLARVQPGQSLLIHAAAGGVGQAAIQIAKHFKMEIFATVSSEAKRALLRDLYGIPDDHIFNSRDISFAKGVMRMTKGRGVDVVLNSLAGEQLRQTWHCIAPFGYFIEIGLRDILANTGLDMAPFKQDATFTFLNLAHVQKSRPDIMAAIVEGTFDFIRQGISRPVDPITAFPISEVEKAFRLMQAGKHTGKLVLTWGKDDVVPVLNSQRSNTHLDADGVYLLVGGFGGLGRSLSERLVALGARKLCFFSRSGGGSKAAKELIGSLEQQGVKTLAIKCDVSSDAAVAAAVVQCSSLGPVRGVFQCAMVLQDATFVNMTYEQWVEATRPKIQGTWNLHKHLPDVDFFVTLSSLVATFGNRGQSNYSAAGAFQDALAYHRRSQGMHATTVDLGIMLEIGVLAETGMTDGFKDWEKPYGIGEAEFHALMEVAIGGDIDGSGPAQVITGLGTGGSAVAAGIELPYYLDNPKFAITRRQGLVGAADDKATAPPHVRIAQAASLGEATAIVTSALVQQVARMLQMPAEDVPVDRALHELGIDSLLAIEVVNWCLKAVQAAVTVFDVLASRPIGAFAAKLAAASATLPKDLAQSA